MELKKMPKLANQFWPEFYNKTMLITISSQVLITIGLAVTLVVTNTFTIGSIMLWLIVSLFLVVSLTVNLLIVKFAMYPTKDLLGAIINVAGEKSSLTPPNPNTEKNESTGLRDALQTVYELSSQRSTNAISKDDAKTAVIKEALDITNCGIIAIGSDKKIKFYNKAAPVRVDTKNEPTLDLLFNGDDTLENWMDICENNAVHAEHVWVRVPDKLPNQENRRFFDVYASYQKGKSTETILTLVDRTATYVVDEENLDFIAFAAHELRGPITVIRGYLDVLSEELAGVLKGDQSELFHRLVVCSNRLSGYVDNILNTSRYDRRHLKMHLVEDSISSIYDTISDDMKLRAGAQNRLLSVKFPNDLPTIAADRASISEVLGNLIDNAIKYSNEGGAINVTAKVNGEFVDISVQDHGIGMPASVVNNLFQKFYRSHRSRETVSGTGIGLYISKAIVESHGGNISVRSEDGRGSTFTISLPIYSTVADKLRASDNNNTGLISEGNGWIKNHSMYRG